MLGLKLTALTLLAIVAGCGSISYLCDGEPERLNHCQSSDHVDRAATGISNGNGHENGNGNDLNNPGNTKSVGRSGEKTVEGGFNSPDEGGPGVRGRSD